MRFNISKFRYKLLIVIKLIILLNNPYCITYASDISSTRQYTNECYFQQFKNVFKRIEETYIGDLDRQQMINAAINGMLRSLDPYSGYFVEDDFDFIMNQANGKFGGIGIEIVPHNGAIKVITPIDNLPASKAGICKGDYIIGVNGQLVSNLGFNKSVQAIRGIPDTMLTLLVVKRDNNETKEIELKRRIITIKPVNYDIEEEKFGGIGYIRISVFNSQTTTDLKKAVVDIQNKLILKHKKLKGIILDMRSNPGGIFEEAITVSEYFLDQDVIVSVKSKDSKNDIKVFARKDLEKAPKVPVVVLIDSGTASAAEIVAGALQDNKRALILGTTSYGKGLVQSFTQIGERKAVKLTTAKYYTPIGKSINATGIKPDIYIENAKVQFTQKDSSNTWFTSSSIKSYLKKYNNDKKIDSTNNNVIEIECHKMSQQYQNDYQYARAYDLIRGLIINEYQT